MKDREIGPPEASGSPDRSTRSAGASRTRTSSVNNPMEVPLRKAQGEQLVGGKDPGYLGRRARAGASLTDPHPDRALAGARQVQHEDALGAADALGEGGALRPKAGDLRLDPRRQLVRGCLPLLRGALGRKSGYP